MSRRDQIQMTPDEIRRFIDSKKTMTIVSNGVGGFPHPMPMWFTRDPDDSIRMATYRTSQKIKNIQRDPRVSLSIVEVHDPYEEIQLRGRVVERRPDPDLAIMDPVSHKYIGKPFPMRSYAGRVALVIAIDRARDTKLPFQHSPPAAG